MRAKRDGINRVIRYSEAFKIEVVKELERDDLSYAQVQRKYGIKGGATIPRWIGQYGNGSRGKVIRVERPEEINEKEALRQRVKRLERLLADTNLDLALERAYTKMACQRAGIEDVEDFKKKMSGKLPT
jgi:transposase-like protein